MGIRQKAVVFLPIAALALAGHSQAAQPGPATSNAHEVWDCSYTTPDLRVPERFQFAIYADHAERTDRPFQRKPDKDVLLINSRTNILFEDYIDFEDMMVIQTFGIHKKTGMFIFTLTTVYEDHDDISNGTGHCVMARPLAPSPQS